MVLLDLEAKSIHHVSRAVYCRALLGQFEKSALCTPWNESLHLNQSSSTVAFQLLGGTGDEHLSHGGKEFCEGVWDHYRAHRVNSGCALFLPAANWCNVQVMGEATLAISPETKVTWPGIRSQARR